MLLQPFLFLASSQFLTSTLIPNPMSFDLPPSCIKSTPNVSLVSRLQSGEAQSRTSLARCVLVCLFSPSIYLFPSCLLYIPLSHHSLPSACFLCLILSSPSPSTLVSSIFIPYLCQPYFSCTFLMTHSRSFRSTWSLPHLHLYKYSIYKLL